MRGKVAKAIRKEIYKDKVSSLASREYVRTRDGSGKIIAEPLRQAYQFAKKAYITQKRK
jgi:hypothetical protein